MLVPPSGLLRLSLMREFQQQQLLMLPRDAVR
jgi:hypothetical protein